MVEEQSHPAGGLDRLVHGEPNLQLELHGLDRKLYEFRISGRNGDLAPANTEAAQSHVWRWHFSGSGSWRNHVRSSPGTDIKPHVHQHQSFDAAPEGAGIEIKRNKSDGSFGLK
jgi:hypothetical protein